MTGGTSLRPEQFLKENSEREWKNVLLAIDPGCIIHSLAEHIKNPEA